MITKYEPRIVPASLDFCRANMNDASSPGMSYEGDAIWEDQKLGARHPAAFERIAIVTNARWAGPAIRIFSLLWPGQARRFPLAELEAAKRWAAADIG